MSELSIAIRMTDEHQRYQSFEEFWPFYVGEHSQLLCRVLHYAAALVTIAILGFVVWTGQWALLPIAPVVAYALAWTGHFVFERNRPATWSYIRWSLIAEFKMFWLFVTGRMGHEVDTHCRLPRSRTLSEPEPGERTGDQSAGR